MTTDARRQRDQRHTFEGHRIAGRGGGGAGETLSALIVPGRSPTTRGRGRPPGDPGLLGPRRQAPGQPGTVGGRYTLSISRLCEKRAAAGPRLWGLRDSNPPPRRLVWCAPVCPPCPPSCPPRNIKTRGTAKPAPALAFGRFQATVPRVPRPSVNPDDNQLQISGTGARSGRE